MVNKRGQLAIFIIIALVIVGVLLILLLYPRIKGLVSGPVPVDYIKDCTEDYTEEALKMVREQGGTLEPENYVLYNGKKVEYACYTNKFFQTCLVQKPFLKQDVEQEITRYIEPKIKSCIDSLKSQLESRGSSVSLGDVEVTTTLVPSSIIVDVDAPMTVTKGETSQFKTFKTSLRSELYDLTMLASSITNYEARYGDSDILTYMLYYPDILVEKKKSDGSTVYTLTHKPSKEKFMFASRSLVWPTGYTGIG